MTDATAKAQQSPEMQSATAVSDERIGELLSADILFRSVPVYNFLEPYLKAIFGFIGITDIHFFRVEGTATHPETLAQTKQDAIAQMQRLLGEEP